MNNQSIQKECIERIINSEEFAGSTTYKSYLTYLVNAKDTGKCLKETTIAIEFFGKTADFNPAEDATVRSHTYTLRKKLETYYLKEGKEDKYRLEIPKGHYEVIFVPVSEDSVSTKSIYTKLAKHKVYFLIITVLCIFIAFLWIQNRSLELILQNYHTIEQSDPIWKDYLKSELPILLVIGDHFFFTDYSDTYENLLAIRDGRINSLEDLENFLSTHPGANLKQADEPYFPYHSIWALPPILSILYSANQKPILRKSSSLSPQILDEYNIIYVGSIKTLYILKHTLSKSHLRFEIAPHKVEYLAPDSTAPQIFHTNLHSAGPNEDLVIVLKLPGPARNTIFIIASYHSLGAPEIANYLTSASKRVEVEQIFHSKYGQIPEYFEILFRVTGIDKTAYNSEILICNKISSEQ